MSQLAEKLSRLSPAQRKLLAQRMAERKGGAQGIPRRTATGPAPLSFAQQRLWFVQTLAPENTAYNMATALRLTGPLDPSVMQAAFAELCRRHHSLRSYYPTDAQGTPVQLLGDPPVMQLEDLRQTPDPEAAAHAALQQIASAPYDLAQVPVRAGLLRLDAAEWMVGLGLHHIAGDRWSIGLLVRELALLYEAQSRAMEMPLPAPPIQMPDFAQWQTTEHGARIEDQLRYWRRQLADLPLLDLPRMPGAKADRAKGGAAEPFAIPADLTQAARAAAQSHGVSLFTLMLTGFNLLLSRYCDSDDIVLGSDLSNRDRPETQALVGPLVNTLALRTDLGGATDFTDALRRTEASFRAALDHQDVPLEQVIEALNPERLPDEIMPLFRAKFDLQQAERLPDTVQGLALRRVPLPQRAAKYELRFNIEDDGETLSGRVEYRADLYDPGTIAAMAQHYLRVLGAALADPTAPLHRLPMLSAAETADLLALSSGPALPQPESQTLHGAFEARADRHPDAPALWHDGQLLSYGALEAKANGVAAAILATDLPPQAKVGICMGRHGDLLAAILGVLKAGCAYVPLDPAYPQARRDLIARDADLTLVLTDDPARIDAPEGARLLDVTALPAAATRPAPRAVQGDLAVIIYTSGSTGTPKGVMLEHGNILARVAWARDSFGAQEMDGMLFATSISFDLSLFEIFATLAMGGRLVLAQSLLDLPRLPEAAQVRFLNSVPSLLRELVKHHDLPPSLRTINLAGEFFPPALLTRLQDFPQLTRINNLYGPTEDAIYDAGNRVEAEPERPLPIGRPFAGSRILVLDRHGALMPRGVAGELCMGGAGLSRGYLNRPELTAAKYIDDPHHRGARLYRSGDRGRWRPDGRIDILGRIDSQVKIRGQRIEIGEIETTLERHDAVAEAVVLVTGEPADADRQLVGFVAPKPGQSLAADPLRDWLAARLPAHLLPQLWQILPSLPRMPNGKVDRKALRLPDRTRETAPAEPPKTPTEATVMALWAGLLERDEIGAEEDFFQAGGHSLLAMRLLVQLQEAFGIELALGEMFEALTPRAQARLIDARFAEAQSAPLAPPQDTDPTAGLSDDEVAALLAQMSEEPDQT